jgi:beta-lactamase class A
MKFMKNNADFCRLINKLKPFGAKVSACIINLKTGKTLEYQPCDLIYPASVYKIFIAAEVLRQVETCKIKLSQKIIIKSPNDIDNESRFYPTDEFPILKAGDKIDVETLIKLMLQRSDNTASNSLIDLVGRESISKNIIKANGWYGSDITRKFLNRLHENKKYRYADITRTCGRHLAEFMQKLNNKTLISQFVSDNLYKYMAHNRSLPDTRLPHRAADNWLNDTLREKGGWIQAYSPKLPRGIRRKYIIRYQSQAAIIQNKHGKFAIGIVSKYSTIFPSRYFKFSKITEWLSE